MNKIIFILALLFIVSCKNREEQLDGKTFIGIEESSGCSDVILAENTLIFYGDSVLLKQKYLKHFSEKKMKDSYQYKGLVQRNKSEIIFDVYAFECPDCQVWSYSNLKTGEVEKRIDFKGFTGYYKDGLLKLNNDVFILN